MNRRQFLHRSGGALLAAATAPLLPARAQVAGQRPPPNATVQVLNPRGRVPVSFIIDDSTCLVNLNRFAMPQFDAAFGGTNPAYHRNWPEWPIEIPDRFVRQFGEWCAAHGVKGKYSIVPYPACVGRLDRGLPGWTRKQLEDSIELVRTVMTPNWDIHPEMVTHTRVIDLKTGHPHPEWSLKFMENWEWTTGRSADEIAAYLAYALSILKEIGLPCEGVTTPGGFGNRALPQLAQASLHALRDVFQTEVPHYFRHAFDRGPESVAPRVEYASGLDSPDPRCVVSIVACTGDWTGGWDNSPPVGADAFITADLRAGRLVEVIERGEPACLLAHWTGIYFNGQETGFKIFQEVVRRLHARFDHLRWMKLADLSRYWAARELTHIDAPPAGASTKATPSPTRLRCRAPFSCPDFTLRLPANPAAPPRLRRADTVRPLREVPTLLQLDSNTWCRTDGAITLCFDLPRGESYLEWA